MIEHVTIAEQRERLSGPERERLNQLVFGVPEPRATDEAGAAHLSVGNMTLTPIPEKTMTLVELEVPGGPVEALLATPTTVDGPWPGVVVVHDIYGFTQDVRDISQRVADGGYLVLTPNLYSRGGGPRCVVRVLRDLVAQHGQALEDVAAAKGFLERRDECAGPIGIIGF